MTQQMLESCGYRVLPAPTPAAALRTVRECGGAIHLPVTDVVMPEMNDHELARQLGEDYPQVKYLHMSGYPAAVIARHGVIEEGVHLIQKPFSLESLVGKEREVLDGCVIERERKPGRM